MTIFPVLLLAPRKNMKKALIPYWGKQDVTIQFHPFSNASSEFLKVRKDRLRNYLTLLLLKQQTTQFLSFYSKHTPLCFKHIKANTVTAVF